MWFSQKQSCSVNLCVRVQTGCTGTLCVNRFGLCSVKISYYWVCADRNKLAKLVSSVQYNRGNTF